MNAIFIDGGYLEKVLKERFESVSIDFEKLGMKMVLCERYGRLNEAERHFHFDELLLRAYYYHCDPYRGEPPTPEENQYFSNKQAFFTYISRINRFEVRKGRLRVSDNRGKKQFEQKGVDVRLAMDMVTHATKQLVDRICLLTGDSDLVPAIQLAKNEGVIVALFYCDRSSNKELLDVVDERYVIDDAFIAEIKRS